jgi:hypothetical protein
MNNIILFCNFIIEFSYFKLYFTTTIVIHSTNNFFIFYNNVSVPSIFFNFVAVPLDHIMYIVDNDFPPIKWKKNTLMEFTGACMFRNIRLTL